MDIREDLIMKKLLKILMSLMLTLSMSAGFVFAEDSTCTGTEDGQHQFTDEYGDYNEDGITINVTYDELEAGTYSKGDTVNVTVNCYYGDATTTITGTINYIDSWEATCVDDAYYFVEVTVTIGENSDQYLSDEIYDEGTATGIHSEYDSDGNLNFIVTTDASGNEYVSISCWTCGTELAQVTDFTLVTDTSDPIIYGNGQIWGQVFVSFTYEGKDYYGYAGFDQDITAESTSEDDSSSSGSSTASSESSSDSVETADSTMLAGYALIGLIALAGVAYLSKKEELQ